MHGNRCQGLRNTFMYFTGRPHFLVGHFSILSPVTDPQQLNGQSSLINKILEEI
jgi:hypothetical protein